MRDIVKTTAGVYLQAVQGLLRKPGLCFLAARPKTLPAGAAPVLTGTALAARHGGGEPLLALMTLLCTAALQIAANLANDYLDYKKGHDTENRLGPLRLTQTGLLTPEEMQILTGAAFGMAALSGLFLVKAGGWPVLVIGLISMAAALGYSLFRKPFGFTGGGEAAAFLFFGPVAVGGTFYLQQGDLAQEALFPGIAIGLYSAALLTVNNYRDMAEDRITGKKTLVVRFGRPGAVLLYAGVLVAPIIGPMPQILSPETLPFSWLPLLSLIPGVILYRRFLQAAPEKKINRLLFATSLTMLTHAVCYVPAALWS